MYYVGYVYHVLIVFGVPFFTFYAIVPASTIADIFIDSVINPASTTGNPPLPATAAQDSTDPSVVKYFPAFPV